MRLVRCEYNVRLTNQKRLLSEDIRSGAQLCGWLSFDWFLFFSQSTFEKRKNKILKAQFQGSYSNTAKHGKYTEWIAGLSSSFESTVFLIFTSIANLLPFE